VNISGGVLEGRRKTADNLRIRGMMVLLSRTMPGDRLLSRAMPGDGLMVLLHR
jgi:hypothetical protein